MFDTVLGLPVHALVVHGVVVLLPLVALVTVWWAWRRPDGARLGWLVVAANAGVTVLTLVAKQSGEELQRRLGGAAAVEHGQLGQWLPWMALGLTAAAVLVQLSRGAGDRAGGRRGATATLVTLVSLLVLVWTIRVGHTGAVAVWGTIVENTGK